VFFSPRNVDLDSVVQVVNGVALSWCSETFSFFLVLFFCCQCWDKYLLKSLKDAADMRGRPEWAAGPSDAGDYNCMPEDSDFFRSGYKSAYGEFFLTWYSESLIEHGDNVLTVARNALGNTKLAAKVMNPKSFS
jgi:hypothetical protein